MATGNQLEIASTTSVKVLGYDETELEEEVSVEDSDSTKRVLYNFVFTRADADTNLSKEQKESFHEAQSTSEKENDGVLSKKSRNALMVGRKLADLGDEIDALYQDQFEDIMELYDDPQEAFHSFSQVLQNVFNWEDGELPTLGHVAAILGYCYHLCKRHVMKFLNSHQLLSLLGTLAGFLVRFFLRSKLYEWIANQGGWGGLLTPSTSSATSWFGLSKYLLIIGAVSVTAFIYLRSRGR